MQKEISLFLNQLGLSEKEITLYLASLRYGAQTASTIALKTGLARSTVNFIFGELIQKGLMSKTQTDGSTLYVALQPESLSYILGEKKANIKKLESNFEDLLPYLKGIQMEPTQIPKVRFYEGLEGVLRAIDESCEKDESVLFTSSHNNMHPDVRDYIEKTYIPLSKVHKNKNRMIINIGPNSKSYLKKAEGVYSEVIPVDSDLYPFKLTTAVRGNFVFFVSYDPKDMSAVVIENQLIADHMRTVFEAMAKKFKEN